MMGRLKGNKGLIFLIVVAVALLLLVDLIVPSLAAGVKGRLPKRTRAYLPFIEIATIVGVGAYVGGTYLSHRKTLYSRRTYYEELGKKGRTFEIVVPVSSSAKAAEMADLLARMWDATQPASSKEQGLPMGLEYVYTGRDGKVHCQVWVPEVEGKSLDTLLGTEVRAKFPDARVLPCADMLGVLGQDGGLPNAFCLEMRLAGPPHYPIKGADKFEVDPLASVLGAIGNNEPGVDFAVVQVVATAVSGSEWEGPYVAELGQLEAIATGGSSGGGGGPVVAFIGSMLSELMPGGGRGGGAAQAKKGRPLTPAEKVKQKILMEIGQGQPAFAVTVRLIVGGADAAACQKRLQAMATLFGQFKSATPGMAQGFAGGKPVQFQPGTQVDAGTPAAAPAPGAPASGLSQSQVLVVDKLRQAMGQPALADSPSEAGDNGHGEVPAPVEGGVAGPAEAKAPPPPVAEAQPILYRLPELRSGIWPPWKQSPRSIILCPGLATIFHFPHKDMAATNVVTRQSKHILPPQDTLVSPVQGKPESLLLMGAADDDRDPSWYVGMPYADLARGGVYVLGPAGTGKSVLLRFLGVQFLREGRGLSVIDPKEDLARDLALDVPLDQEGQVAWIHPASLTRPVVVNIMDARLIRRVGAAQVASGTVAVFKKMIGASWDVAVNVRRLLENAIQALAEGEPTPSLLSLWAFLQPDADEDTPNQYRAQVVARVHDPVVSAFWTTQFAAVQQQYAQSMVSVMTRVESFLRNPMARYLTGLRWSTINFREILDGRGIFLASIPQTLGDVRTFVGALLFNQLVAAGFSRYGDTPEDQRNLAVIIVDEFQNVAADASEDMEALLSMLRGAKVATIMAHQSTAQISQQTMQIILANNQTRVIFALTAEQDARTVVGPWRSVLTGQDLMGLQTARHEVYMALLVRNTQTGVFSAKTLMAPKPRPEPLPPLPAAEFVWAEGDEFDEVVNEIAAWEEPLVVASRTGDRDKEAHCLAQQSAILKKMTPEAYARYAERRRARDEAERAYIIANPVCIDDKLERIIRLSGLRFGIPRCEAEWLVARAMEQVMGKPVDAAGVVSPSAQEVPEFDMSEMFL